MVYVLSLHIIFMVCWFAGLFYIVRLYIYSTEANSKIEPEKSILLNQFQIMKRRLWFGITWPAGVLTLFFGSWMLIVYTPHDLVEAWFILKMIFVGLLILYHLQCHIIYKQQSKSIFNFSSIKLRLFNELATIVLFACVFLVEIRSNTNWIYLVIGIFFLVVLIVISTLLYKKQRVKEVDEKEKV